MKPDAILPLIREGKSQVEIAQQLGISESYVSKLCKRLAMAGLIELDVRSSSKIWKIKLETHEETLGNFPTDLSSSPLSTPNKLQLRLHRLQRNYPLLAQPDASKLGSLKEIPVASGKQWIGKHFRITNNILELEGIQLVSHRGVPAAFLEGIAITLADNLARSLAQLYALQIDLAHATSPPNLTEIELTEHEMAGRVRKKGKIGLHWDEHLQMDVWMDKSFGFGGLESNRVAYIQKLTDFTNDLVDNDSWTKLKQQAFVQSESMTRFAHQLDLHLTVLSEMRDTLKQMKDASKPPSLWKRLYNHFKR